MTEKEIKLKIIENAETIAKEITKGKDIMITKTPSGVAIKKLTVQKV